MSSITLSIFNNKGGVGKTSIIWNLAVSLADMNKNILLIDFDPQCNLSIAVLGDKGFENCLETSPTHPFGKTIRSFAQPYILQNTIGKFSIHKPKFNTKNNNLDVIAGDFWLNNFADVLNVGTDVIGGAGLYRFLLLHKLVSLIEEEENKKYDFILIDLPPSFNTLVRSALYCSDYFIVPCTPDLFSAYCVGLIGEVLPNFILDWEQGKQRYLSSNKYDLVVATKGQPKFAGWIFNGYDTRLTQKTGADKAQFNHIQDAITSKLMPRLKEIKSYQCVPDFVSSNPIAEIQDLNVMAPDSIVQNIPIKYLPNAKPTRDIGRGTWSQNQKELMREAEKEYDNLSSFMCKNF